MRAAGGVNQSVVDVDGEGVGVYGVRASRRPIRTNWLETTDSIGIGQVEAQTFGVVIDVFAAAELELLEANASGEDLRRVCRRCLIIARNRRPFQ